MIALESFVSYETNELLHKAGFDWYCQTTRCFTNEDGTQVCAPTLATAQIWLMKRGLLLYLIPCHKDKRWEWRWGFLDCRDINDTNHYHSIVSYETYEKALDAGINRALKFLLKE